MVISLPFSFLYPVFITKVCFWYFILKIYCKWGSNFFYRLTLLSLLWYLCCHLLLVTLLLLCIIVVCISNVVEISYQLFVIFLNEFLWISQVYVLVKVFFFHEFRIRSLFYCLKFTCGLLMLLLNFGLLETKSSRTLSEVSLEELSLFSIVIIGDVLERDNFFSKYLILQPLRSNNSEKWPDGSDNQSDNVDDLISTGCIVVRVSFPQEEPQGKDEEWKLERFNNKSNKILPKSHRIRISPENIILINPILNNEDEDENRSTKRKHKSIPTDNIDINNIERISSWETERRMLKYLVQLDLEEVYWLISCILSSVQAVCNHRNGEDSQHNTD